MGPRSRSVSRWRILLLWQVLNSARPSVIIEAKIPHSGRSPFRASTYSLSTSLSASAAKFVCPLSSATARTTACLGRRSEPLLATPDQRVALSHTLRHRRRVVGVRRARWGVAPVRQCRPRSKSSALTATVICSLSATSITGSPSIFITQTRLNWVTHYIALVEVQRRRAATRHAVAALMKIRNRCRHWG
jgi:hypothetical protein